MIRSLVLIVLIGAGVADAARVRFDAAGDPFERNAVFRVDLDLPVRTIGGASLGAGYGQRSFWTLENDGSNDRVETDFAPTVYARTERGRWRGQLGYVHESNGLLNSSSRAWNRIVGRLRRSLDAGVVELQAWYVVSREDTNPDLRRAVGDGSLVFATDHTAAWAGELKLGFTFDPPDEGPITNVRARLTTRPPRVLYDGDDLSLALELFWGRGESLFRYDEIVRAVRFGVTVFR